MISIIAAMDNNSAIGYRNSLPWGSMPSDMKHFRNTTTGKTIVMGRKTFDSIGKPLPKRRNIILSTDTNLKIEGCEVIHSINDVVTLAETEDIVVIGGSEVYKLLLPYADILYLTKIHDSFDGDTFFPSLDLTQWHISKERVEEATSNTPKLTFTTLKRKRATS